MAEHQNENKENTKLFKKVIPSDNSCLFTSIAFGLNQEYDENLVSIMRSTISDAISKDKDTYNSAFLGKSNEDYSNWIQKPESWGGAIELSIFCNIYNLEIAVLNSINGDLAIFGEDKNYDSRIYLIFDGIHYDTLYSLNEDQSMRTIFSSHETNILNEAKRLAAEAKSTRAYTDVENFNLKCFDCGQVLTGQKEATEHAKQTSHKNFGEF